MSHYETLPIVILGAGLSGSCTALELARRGYEVTLLDQDDKPMNRASLRNEGKIHLGLCYANDPTFETATLQLRGALKFRSLLNKWIGHRSEELTLSTPFVYAVATDSLVGASVLAERYSCIESIYLNMIETDPELDYFGRRPKQLFRQIDSGDLETTFNVDQIKAGFITEELAIDPAQLAVFIRDAIEDSPKISFVSGFRVESVSRATGSFRIDGCKNETALSINAVQVVNSTWEGRLILDKGMGVLNGQNWLHRLKYRVIARLPECLHGGHSVSMVLGPYGDVVIRPDGTSYLSWYPAGLQGWTNDVAPPKSWSRPCQGEVDDQFARQIAHNIIGAIDEWYPGVLDVEVVQVDAGAIVACGNTDVDDASSELHTRTAIGVWSHDGYHSLDPGKLTTAPLFAHLAADRVEKFVCAMQAETVADNRA